MTHLANTNMLDSFKERKALVGDGNFLTIYVENTLPIFITNDDYLNNKKIKFRETPGSAVTTSITDYNKEMENRFVNIANVESPLTYNKISLYYDKKYEDIIIVPNLDVYTITKNGNYEVRALRLGSSRKLQTKYVYNMLGTEPTDIVKLPLAKANTSVKGLLVSLTGLSTEGNLNNNRFEEMVDNVHNLLHQDRKLGTIIELGTGSQLFTENKPLAVYLLSQHSIMDYGLEDIKLQDVASKKLYFILKF